MTDREHHEYQGGPWSAVVHGPFLALVEPDAPWRVVDGLWRVASQGGDVLAALNVVTADGFTALPRFAVVRAEADGSVHAVLRGPVRLRLHGADGAQEVTAGDSAVWTEHRAVGVRGGVELFADDAPDATWWPLVAGVVRAGGVRAGSAVGTGAGAAAPATATHEQPVVAPAADEAPAPAVAPDVADAAQVPAGPVAVEPPVAATPAEPVVAATTAEPWAPAADAWTPPAPVAPDEDVTPDPAPVPDLGAGPAADLPAADLPAADLPASGLPADAPAPDLTDAERAAGADATQAAPLDDWFAPAAPAATAAAVPADPDAAPTERLSDELQAAVWDDLPVASGPDAEPTERLSEEVQAAVWGDEPLAPTAPLDVEPLAPTAPLEPEPPSAPDIPWWPLTSEGAAAEPQPAPVPAAPADEVPAGSDDHDGMTILSSDLARLRDRLPAWSQDAAADATTPEPPVAVTARMVLSTGLVVTLDRPVLLGRAPQVARVTNRELPRLVTVPSPNQDISRTHAEVRVEGDHVVVTDLESTNGVHVSRPGEGVRRLHPGEPSVVGPGEVVDLGDGVTFTVERSAS